jgi:hypothetical protein
VCDRDVLFVQIILGYMQFDQQMGIEWGLQRQFWKSKWRNVTCRPATEADFGHFLRGASQIQSMYVNVYFISSQFPNQRFVWRGPVLIHQSKRLDRKISIDWLVKTHFLLNSLGPINIFGSLVGSRFCLLFAGLVTTKKQ